MLQTIWIIINKKDTYILTTGGMTVVFKDYTSAEKYCNDNALSKREYAIVKMVLQIESNIK